MGVPSIEGLLRTHKALDSVPSTSHGVIPVISTGETKGLQKFSVISNYWVRWKLARASWEHWLPHRFIYVCVHAYCAYYVCICYVYAYVCVFMYVYVYLNMSVYVCCMYVYVYTCMYGFTYICVYIYICMYVCICIDIWLCACVSMHVWTYMFICMYLFGYIYICVYICVFICKSECVYI